MEKQTIKLKESQLRQMIKESLKELDWKTYKNAANKRLAQGKYANANELSDMAKNRFDDEFNDNYRYDTLGAKLAGKHSKTFDSTFIPTEEPRLQGRNEKGEELFRNNGRYYNSRRGLTTPEKFFKDKQMSDTFNAATQELDDYNGGNYDYAQDKGWHLKESRLNKIIKESIKKALKESVIKSREFLDKDENVCYGEDEMSFFAANYLRNEFRRFHDIAKAKACAQEMLQREKRQRAEEMSGLRY